MRVFLKTGRYNGLPLNEEPNRTGVLIADSLRPAGDRAIRDAAI